MLETEIQKLVVDAVIEGGGTAMKLNNAFINGIADLLIKLPKHPAFIMEAKKKVVGAKTRGLVFDLGVTQLQKNFLRDWWNAGTITGVLSFVIVAGKDVRSLQMAAYGYSHMAIHNWQGSQGGHVALGDKTTRNERIIQCLLNFVRTV